MTKKEKAYILAKAEQYLTWAKQERMEAKTSSDPEEREDHYQQEAMNSASADALYNLLAELLEGV